MPAAKRSTPKPKPPTIDLHARGARIVSVFGQFNSRVLVEMSTNAALEVFPDGALVGAGRMDVVDAVERDVEALRRRDPALADSTLAASALAMAYELANPYNSATSKSMCHKALQDAMRELRELAPPAEERDELDDLAARRVARRSQVGGAGA